MITVLERIFNYNFNRAHFFSPHHFEYLFACSYDTSSHRKKSDRSKRSQHRRSPESSRRPHRQQRHREDRSQSTSRRRHRERAAAKERQERTEPVKVKTIRFLCNSFFFRFGSFCLFAKIICMLTADRKKHKRNNNQSKEKSNEFIIWTKQHEFFLSIFHREVQTIQLIHFKYFFTTYLFIHKLQLFTYWK